MGVNEFIQIGTRIKCIRLNKGLTQKDVADKMGIPYSTYSNYENNNREPNFETIKLISQTLGVSVELLLYGETGVINSDTANYLLTLSGFVLMKNSDETYTIQDIENNKVVGETVVTNRELQKIVIETSDYVTYLTKKLF